MRRLKANAAIACTLLVLVTSQVFAGEASFSNPIIPGFAPDPSIVRVEDDFYLVNSTFEYFPGIPVYHSKDLVDWQLIGHAIHDPAQADLARIKSSDGIHASTIRYHDGLFYVITTNNIDGDMVNFIVIAEDPAGPWSKPHVLEGAPGIDPSLFFDDDGRVWYAGNRVPPDPEFPGQAEIWLQEVDLENFRLIGKRHYLWRGCCGGGWAEGPHIYKKDGYYYLLISEGGTSFDHALAIAISKEITGPYTSNARNPVLTHRHLSYDYPISGVGHADLVELEDGRWFAVALGWRLVDGKYGILGRETFLVPVTWEQEPYAWKEEKLSWPVFGPETGKVELEYPTPFGNAAQQADYSLRDDFDTLNRSLEWSFRRTPATDFVSIDETAGELKMRLLPAAIGEREQYAFTGIRQRHFEFEATTSMKLVVDEARAEAGMALIQNDRSALVFTLTGDGVLKLLHNRDGDVTEFAEVDVNSTTIHLKVTGDYLDLGFHYSADGKTWQTLIADVDGSVLAPERIGGFNYTGVYIGLYGATHGAGEGYAVYDFLEYRSTATDANDWFGKPEPTTYDLYFLGGQSNMEGFGFNDQLPPGAATQSGDVMIFAGQMALDNETHGGEGLWQPLEPGFGTGFRTDGETNQLSDRFGPELLFGSTMAKRGPNRKVAIVKYALGGSGLADGVGYGNWHPDFTTDDGINQYDHALKTLRGALAHADIDGDGSLDKLVPSGIVWMQGEADAYDSQAAADAYRGNLGRLMDLLRAAMRIDDLPVVIGRITDSGMADDGTVMDYIETVQNAQRDFVDSDPCAAYVTVTDELSYLDDGWHYDSEGFIRMGTAFADAMVELRAQCARSD